MTKKHHPLLFDLEEHQKTFSIIINICSSSIGITRLTLQRETQVTFCATKVLNELDMLLYHKIMPYITIIQS